MIWFEMGPYNGSKWLGNCMSLSTQICTATQQLVPKDMMVRLALLPLRCHGRPVALRDSVAVRDFKRDSYKILCEARLPTKWVPPQSAYNERIVVCHSCLHSGKSKLNRGTKSMSLSFPLRWWDILSASCYQADFWTPWWRRHDGA